MLDPLLQVLAQLVLPFPEDRWDVLDVERELGAFLRRDDHALPQAVGVAELVEDVRPQLRQVDQHERRPPDALENLREYAPLRVLLGNALAFVAELAGHLLQRVVGIVQVGTTGIGHDHDHEPRRGDLLRESDDARRVLRPVGLDGVELLVVEPLHEAGVFPVEVVHFFLVDLRGRSPERRERQQRLLRDPRPVRGSVRSLEAADQDHDVRLADALGDVERLPRKLPVGESRPDDRSAPVDRLSPCEDVADHTLLGVRAVRLRELLVSCRRDYRVELGPTAVEQDVAPLDHRAAKLSAELADALLFSVPFGIEPARDKYVHSLSSGPAAGPWIESTPAQRTIPGPRFVLAGPGSEGSCHDDQPSGRGAIRGPRARRAARASWPECTNSGANRDRFTDAAARRDASRRRRGGERAWASALRRERASPPAREWALPPAR